jgi:hypothetical protein
MSEDKSKKTEEVLIEVPEVAEETSEAQDLSSLSKEEIELGKKHGLIKDEEVVDAKDSKDEGKADKVTDSKESEEPEVGDPATFEEMEEVLNKDAEKFHKKFTPNAKALYFKHKKERQERQRIAKEFEELKAGQELAAVKESANSSKLKKINEALGSEDLTVEKLKAIIGDVEEPVKDEPKAKEDAKATADKVYMQRVDLATQIGRSKYKNFDQISDLVQEMVKEDQDYAGIISSAFQGLYNNKVDEDTVVEKVVKIAKLSPKFKELESNVSNDKKEEVDRAIKNSNKKLSSASLGGSGKSNFKSEDMLTPEDVVNFSTSKWMALSKKTRDRLLQESS